MSCDPDPYIDFDFEDAQAYELRKVRRAKERRAPRDSSER